MEFSVLGTIEVRDGDRIVDVGPRMQRALLAALLLEPGRAVSLDRLTDALWGDAPPAGALGALQVYVANLRRVLEPGRPARARPTVLVTQPPGYALRADPGAIDAERFAALVGAGRTALAAGDPLAAVTALRQAVGLWRGSPYADLSFEAFLQAEIARLTELHAEAWERLAEAELAVGAHAAMVADLERLAREEPIRERRWELLAVALYRSGRQTEALRVLQQARRALVDELGIEPGAALRRLEQDILQHAPALEWRPPVAPSPPAKGRRAAPRPAPGQPLVGRDAELGQLRAAVDHVVADVVADVVAGVVAGPSAGHGRAAVISGEPGIGKTRLAEELSDYASDRDVQVAWGRVPEGEAAPAYWPWVQIVRTLAAAGDPDKVRRALAVDAEELVRLVPEVREVAGHPLERPPDAAPDTARARLYDAVVGFILRLAGERALLLVVDDVHGADGPTLQLVQVLAGRLAEAPVLLVVTYREHEAAAAPSVVATIGALARLPDLLRVRLGGLTEPDVLRLVAHTTGAPASPEVGAAISARSDGNPFFVSELLQLLRSTGHLHRSEIPSGVRDVIRQRLARLPEASASLLAPAAVAGRTFPLDVVASAAGLDDDRALELVESALVAGVVAEDPASVGSYRFSHSLVRETIYDGLSALRRARLHRAVGQILARDAGPDDDRAAEIADHFYAASAAPGQGAEAHTWAIRAADRAARVLAFEQAEALIHRAVELARRTCAPPEALGQELAAQRRLAGVLLMKHWYGAPEVGEAWAGVVDLCRRIDDSPDVLTALWGAWSYRYVRADLARALDIADEMLARAARLDDVVLEVVGHHCAGTVCAHAGRLDDAVEHFGRVGARVDEVPAKLYSGTLFEPDLRLAHGAFRGLIECLTVGVDGYRTLDASVAEARGLGRPLGVVAPLFLAALGRIIHGDREGAERLATDAMCLAEEHGFRLLGAMVGVLRTWATMDAAGMRDALDAFLGTGSRMLLHLFWGLLADVERSHGHRDEALACLERALAEAASTGERLWEPELHRLRGELLLGTPPDRRAEAEASFLAGLALAREQGASVFERRITESMRGAVGLQSRPRIS